MGMRLILSDFDWWDLHLPTPIVISGKGRFVEQQMNLSSGSTSPNLWLISNFPPINRQRFRVPQFIFCAVQALITWLLSSCYDLSSIWNVDDQLDSQPLCAPHHFHREQSGGSCEIIWKNYGGAQNSGRFLEGSKGSPWFLYMFLSLRAQARMGESLGKRVVLRHHSGFGQRW